MLLFTSKLVLYVIFITKITCLWPDADFRPLYFILRQQSTFDVFAPRAGVAR